MTWFRVDDGFHSHPKVLAVSLAARGLWVTCGSWSSGHLTDGFIKDQVLASLGGTPELAEELVAEGLWRRRKGGYQFHDWTDKNPTREAVEKDRAAAAERQRRRRGGKSSRRDSGVTNGGSHRGSHTTPSRRDGELKTKFPIPSRSDARASPEGSRDVADKPPWCGKCDERTRLTDEDNPRRCPDCHPAVAEVPS